jgi:peptidoglycan hydrolase-like protein with peptidoglycan-binding domain
VRFISVLLLVIAGQIAPAVADTRALVIGNAAYDAADPVEAAEDAALAAEALGNVGFRVIAGQDLPGADLRAGLGQFLEGDAPERAVILLSGHFAHSKMSTWFLGTDADMPALIGADEVGLPMSLVLEAAARTPGGAVVLLAEGESELPLGSGLSVGVGTLWIPQGVTVVQGSPEAVVDFAVQGLTATDAALPSLLAQWPELAADGFLSPLLPFLTEEMIAEHVDEAAREAEAAERELWQAAQDAGTIAAYEAYLTRYPDGRFAGAAREAIARRDLSPAQIETALGLTREERREVQRHLTLLGFDTRGIDGIFGPGTRTAIRSWQMGRGLPETGYLNAHQLTLLAEEAALRQSEIEEEQRQEQLAAERADREYWRDTGSGRDEAGLRAYLARYPDGLFSDVARARLAEFVAARDRRAWDAAQALDTITAYRRYLNEFPEGIFAARARARIAEIESAAEAERDRRAWDVARAADTIAAYRQYLGDFPRGAYVDRARTRIAELERAEAERDRRAWEAARDADTPEAYRRYLRDFPDGAYADRARARLAELEPEEDPGPAQAAEAALNLNVFTRTLIERQLQALGFDPGRVDGSFDADTRRAIRQYQRARGLPVTGYVNQAMIARLIADGLIVPFN